MTNSMYSNPVDCIQGSINQASKWIKNKTFKENAIYCVFDGFYKNRNYENLCVAMNTNNEFFFDDGTDPRLSKQNVNEYIEKLTFHLNNQ